MLESRIEWLFIFLNLAPIKAISIKLRYTKILISEIPIIISEIIRPVIGIKYLYNLFLKCILENNAIAVIGVKFGG